MSSSTNISVQSDRYDLGDSIELIPSSEWKEEWTAKEAASVRLQLLGRVLCCKNKPRVRWIRSKGAILVLLWKCLVLDSFSFVTVAISGVLQLNNVQSNGQAYLLVTLIMALSLMLLYPLAGWIADVYFGRYRVIKASLWLMWTGAILFSSCLCLNMLLSPGHEGFRMVMRVVFLPVALLVMEAGIAAFHANFIPFGIDQLSMGSEDQLSGFITWFVFSLFFNVGLLSYPFSCPLFGSSSVSLLLRLLFQTALLSVALVLDSFCSHWLAMEPHTSNPFKLVARVLNYARKHKRPQFRSAFTYLDHIKPSRIEYAKRSYGGPFSTEQVEDVKTFLRIACALIPMGAALTLDTYSMQATTLLSEHVKSGSLSCYAHQAMGTYFPLFLIVCVIPFHEFVLHPILHNYIPSMFTRGGIGIVLTALSYAAFFTVDLMGHTTKYNEQDGSVNYTCLFDDSSPFQYLNMNSAWTILPGSLTGLGTVFLSTAVCEFTFSQSPYNMKGLFMGTLYATYGMFLFLGLSVQFPFYLGYADTLKAFPTCGSVYTLLLLALTVIWFVVYVLVTRGYHKRERGETKRQQDYSEEYYSKYLGSGPS